MHQKNQNPLVSILIPCWGCREYIGQAIDSALNQDYEPIEIIVVEDCGDDGTYEEALRIKDPRLTVHRNTRNLGQFANKNKCLEYSKGSLIKYLDGDDVLHENCVSTLVEAWKCFDGRVCLVLAGYTIIDKDGNHITTAHKWGLEGLCSGIKVLETVTQKKEPGSRFGNPSANLISKEALLEVGGFPYDHSWSGDWETFLKILTVGDVVFLNDILSQYRIQPKSVGHTRNVTLAINDNLLMLDRLGGFFKAKQQIPSYLTDSDFIKEWKVWASSNMIMPQFIRKITGRRNIYGDIKEICYEEGLKEVFDRYIYKNLPGYIYKTLKTKIRKYLKLAQHPRLFNKKEAEYIKV
ncbi:MAG: glycosyltransferase family 2 protein [Planctomycetota bacterium]|jgi:glycosyltransferase involved in cell wall biosynthesis